MSRHAGPPCNHAGLLTHEVMTLFVLLTGSLRLGSGEVISECRRPHGETPPPSIRGLESMPIQQARYRMRRCSIFLDTV